MIIIRFICHCKNWNSWRKNCLNSKLYKLHAFFRPKTSPTFMQTMQYFVSNGKIVSWSYEFMRERLEGMKEGQQDET